MKRSPYEVLGITFSASDQDVNDRYRTLAKQWHPDRNPAPDAAERFREITEARNALLDPKRRVQAMLDEFRRRSPPVPSAVSPAPVQLPTMGHFSRFSFELAKDSKSMVGSVLLMFGGAILDRAFQAPAPPKRSPLKKKPPRAVSRRRLKS